MLFHNVALVIVYVSDNLKNSGDPSELYSVYINLPYQVDFKLMVSNQERNERATSTYPQRLIAGNDFMTH